MKEKIDSKVDKITEEMKQLVIARIEAQISPNLRLSIGSDGSLGKDEMIERVQKGDEVGKQIIQVHLNFLRAQATGQLVSALNSV